MLRLGLLVALVVGSIIGSSAWTGNVSYLSVAVGAPGFFFLLFGNGNSPAAIAGASVVTWVIYGLVLRGIQGAAALNAM